MNPLNAKTPYMDKSFRSKELAPVVGFASRESAIAYLNAVLDDYRTQPSFNPEQIQSLLRLLVELELEALRQVGDSVDFRGVSNYQQALKQSLSDQRNANYNAEVIKAWETVKQCYKATGKLQIDLGEFTCEPTLLSIRGEKPVSDWALEPTDSIGIVRAYEVKEEQFSKQTWREINTNPDSQISVGHLHAFLWDLEVYPKVPEPVYHSFKGWVETHLSQFEKEHGSLTPQLTFKSSDTIKSTWGGQSFLVGWKITMPKATDEPQKSLLSRLLSKAKTK